MPNKEHVKVNEAFLKKIEEYARLGLTHLQISQMLGIPHSTYNVYKQEKYPSIQESYDRGKAKGISEVADALLKKCVQEDALKADTKAQIFYLKAIAKWRDNEETDFADMGNAHNAVVMLPDNDRETQ